MSAVTAAPAKDLMTMGFDLFELMQEPSRRLLSALATSTEDPRNGSAAIIASWQTGMSGNPDNHVGEVTQMLLHKTMLLMKNGRVGDFSEVDQCSGEYLRDSIDSPDKLGQAWRNLGTLVAVTNRRYLGAAVHACNLPRFAEISRISDSDEGLLGEVSKVIAFIKSQDNDLRSLSLPGTDQKK